MQCPPFRLLIICILACILELSAAKPAAKVERFYFKDGLISLEKFYNKKNKLDSLKSYHKSGELNEIFYYRKGKYHGTCKKFSRTGVHNISWIYVKGELQKRIDHEMDNNIHNEDKRIAIRDQILEANLKLKKKSNDINLIYHKAYLHYQLNETTLALDGFLKVEKHIQKSGSVTSGNSSKFEASLYDAMAGVYTSYEMRNLVLHYKYKAVKASPKQNRLYYNLGAYLTSIKSYRLGIAFLNKTLEMAPKHSFAHWALGNTYTDLERYELAMEHINIAYEREANLYKHGFGTAERDVRTTRGFLYHKLGQSEKGIEDLKEALDINPDNSYAYRNLGIIYTDLENYELACEHLNKSKSLGYIQKHDNNDINDYLTIACERKTPEHSKETPFNLLPYLTPNPAGFMIKVENYAFQNFEYTVLDYTSKIVQQGKANMNEIQIYDLKPGVYVLNISHTKAPQELLFIKTNL